MQLALHHGLLVLLGIGGSIGEGRTVLVLVLLALLVLEPGVWISGVQVRVRVRVLRGMCLARRRRRSKRGMRLRLRLAGKRLVIHGVHFHFHFHSRRGHWARARLTWGLEQEGDRWFRPDPRKSFDAACAECCDVDPLLSSPLDPLPPSAPPRPRPRPSPPPVHRCQAPKHQTPPPCACTLPPRSPPASHFSCRPPRGCTHTTPALGPPSRHPCPTHRPRPRPRHYATRPDPPTTHPPFSFSLIIHCHPTRRQLGLDSTPQTLCFSTRLASPPLPPLPPLLSTRLQLSMSQPTIHHTTPHHTPPPPYRFSVRSRLNAAEISAR